MKKIIWGLALCYSAAVSFAQTASNNCPPSQTRGLHIVQPGETYYGIAKAYGLTINQLCDMNNMRSTDLLPVCTQLRVKQSTDAKGTAPATYSATAEPGSPQSSYVKPGNTSHVIVKGETLYSIAKRYGYTVDRLLAMNSATPETKFYVGDVLTVSECADKNATGGGNFARNTAATSTQGTATKAELPTPVTHSTETTDAATTVHTTYAMNTKEYWDNYFNNSKHIKVFHLTNELDTPESIGKYYNLTGDEVLAMNGLSSPSQMVPGMNLRLEDRSVVFADETTIVSTQTDTYYPPAEYSNSTSNTTYWGNNEATETRPEDYIANRTTAPQNAANTTAPTAAGTGKETPGASTMNAAELDMVREINLIRGNPVGYIPIVEEHIAKMVKDGDNSSSITSAYELIADLRRTPALSILQPKDCIYYAARAHGEYQKSKGNMDHTGYNNSMPWDRVKAACSDLQDGNENLVGGPADIRRAVMLLLIDDGISNRGHRRTLLNPDWKYVACYNAGKIGDMPNCWTQKFGY